MLVGNNDLAEQRCHYRAKRIEKNSLFGKTSKEFLWPLQKKKKPK